MSPMSGENTVTPVMSDGSRSGWPWTRESGTPSAVAMARASTVLPTPGTSSMRRWLPDRAATTARVTARGVPRSTSDSATCRFCAVAIASSTEGPG